MITFRQAPTVAPGSRPTSTQFATLAEAINTRRLSGVADWCWREAYYLINLWRQVRNPAEDGLTFPSQLEFWWGYNVVNPDKTTKVWPDPEHAAGDWQGANLANPMMAMIHGVGDLLNEPSRYLDVPLYSGETEPTLRQLWDIGVLQRGARDPATLLQGSPVADAAESWQTIVQPVWSPHGKSYGGYLPTPELGTTGSIYANECGDSEEFGEGILSYKIKFTGLRSDVAVATHHGTLSTVDGKPVVTYDGSCPCGSTFNAAKHVVGLWEGPQGYYVVVSTAGSCASLEVVRYPFEDWIEGPYDQPGVPAHTPGGHLSRVVHAFASDYRGSYEQRAGDDYRIKNIAFDVERFLRRQYQLAPARGFSYQIGGDWFIDALYPEARWLEVTTIADGSAAAYTAGPEEYACEAGHVIAGFIAEAQNLVSLTTISAYDGTTRLGSVRLTPGVDGRAEGMLWFEVATCASALKFVCSGGATFSPAGQIFIEVAELVDRKPNYWDAMVVLRMGAANNGRQVDGRGVDTTDSREIGERLFEYGCIQGDWPNDSGGGEVNTNPVYDVARRVTNNLLRVITRQQFVAYEVANGKSVLYLQRFTAISGETLDLLQGIAPSIEALGANPTTDGETYVVRSDLGTGTATYLGTTYTAGQTFTATDVSVCGVTGDAMVLPYDGIRTVALQRGWTNRWCSFVETKHYHPSNSSIWKADAFGDYWAFEDRCHHRSGSFPLELRRMVSYNYGVEVDGEGRITRTNPRGQAGLYAPEAPPGWRYANGANQYAGATEDQSERFRRSCRVYEPPLEIESAVMHDHAQGVVKITFSGRFHTHEDAPTTWSATPPTWDPEDPKPALVTALEAEQDPITGGYRTVDNALRSYHVHNANSHWNAPLTIGDYGLGSAITSDGGAPYGAIYPTIFLCALVNAPYDDGNDIFNAHDTRMTIDEMQKMEWMLRAGCEGWMDNLVTESMLCAMNYGSIFNEGHIFDFTYASLNFQAHGGRWIGSIGLAARPETPEGFGPLPCTKIYVETFNRVSACVNLLTRARMPVPSKMQYNRFDYESFQARNFNTGNGCRYLNNTTGPAATTLVNESGWTDLTIPDFVPPGFTPRQWCVATDTPQDGLIGRRYRYDTRIVPEPGWTHCLPPGLLELLQSGYGGFVARRQKYRGWDDRLNPACDWDEVDIYEDETCGAFSTGMHEADPPPPGDFMLSPPGVRGTEANEAFRLMLTNQHFIEVPTV